MAVIPEPSSRAMCPVLLRFHFSDASHVLYNLPPVSEYYTIIGKHDSPHWRPPLLCKKKKSFVKHSQFLLEILMEHYGVLSFKEMISYIVTFIYFFFFSFWNCKIPLSMTTTVNITTLIEGLQDSHRMDKITVIMWRWFREWTARSNEFSTAIQPKTCSSLTWTLSTPFYVNIHRSCRFSQVWLKCN